MENKKNTIGFQKFFNYFQSNVENPSFARRVESLRVQCDLPKKGIKIPPLTSREGFVAVLEKNKIGRFLVYIFHTEGGFRLVSNDGKVTAQNCNEINKIVEGLLMELDLPPHWFEDVLFYFLFNTIRNAGRNIEFQDVCAIDYSATVEPSRREKKDIHKKRENPFDLKRYYPIVIRIGVNAGENEIVSFIKRVYTSEIKPLQMDFPEYGKIKNVRRKSPTVQMRNRFIYQNKDKTGKEIARLVKENYGVSLPYQYVHKIIYSEKLKRKKA